MWKYNPQTRHSLKAENKTIKCYKGYSKQFLNLKHLESMMKD